MATRPQVKIIGQPEWQQIYAQTFDEHSPYVGVSPDGVELAPYVRGNTPRYFPNLAGARRASTASQRSIVVCVPCYNETVHGLQNTLDSLCHLVLHKGYELDVVILMDGVKPIPDCTKEFLTAKFGVNWSDFNCEHPDEPATMLQTTTYESLPNVAGRASLRQTFGNAGGAVFSPTDDARISLLIKRQNHKKYNSHEWFMQAFAAELHADYIFCTDCATTFEKDMMMLLVEKLENDPQTIAVCGTMRVMPAEMQREDRKVDCGVQTVVLVLHLAAVVAICLFVMDSLGWTLSIPSKAITAAAICAPLMLSAADAGVELKRNPWKWFLRRVQTYEVEADHPISKAAWNLLGFLPVLPGPCGLYRAKDLLERSPKYFEIVKKPAEDCGLTLANLKIAEDRIPSLLAVFPMPVDGFPLKPEMKQNMVTHWVRDAIFYFEAEEELSSLVAQRRRWLNGTNCGFLWTLGHLLGGTLCESPHDNVRKFCITMVMFMQSFTIVIMSVAVGIFATILFSSTHLIARQFHEAVELVDRTDLSAKMQDPVQDNATPIAAGTTAFYLMCYLLFLFVHRTAKAEAAAAFEKKKEKMEKAEAAEAAAAAGAPDPSALAPRAWKFLACRRPTEAEHESKEKRAKLARAGVFVGWAWGMVIFLNVLVLGLFATSLFLDPDGGSETVKPVVGHCVNPTADGCTAIARRCGPAHGVSAWAESNMQCGASCPLGTTAECENDELCYNGMNQNGPCAESKIIEGRPSCNEDTDCHADHPTCWKMCHPIAVVKSRCGRTFEEAAQTCGRLCPSGQNHDCDAGDTCFAGLPSALKCDTGGSRLYAALYACMYRCCRSCWYCSTSLSAHYVLSRPRGGQD